MSQSIIPEPYFYESGQFLVGKQKNYFSQFGEDGLIQATFENYGMQNKHCLEVGAADGIFFSNTRKLMEEGWNCIWIESDKEKYGKLEQCANDKIVTVFEHVQSGSLDRILDQFNAPIDIDFVCIDVDGQDFYIWEGMKKYCPRVILIEYGRASDTTDDDTLPLEGAEGQAGMNPIIELGRSKGYVSLVRTYVNLLFVRKDVCEA